MHPWLVYTPWLRLPTYFTCLMVGFVLATAVARREARRSAIPEREVVELALWTVPTVLVGARLAHVLLLAPWFYLSNPLEFFELAYGGFVFYGGLIAGALLLWRWSRWHGHDPWHVADVFAPATAFGLAFGRLGCLGAGCCYGKLADWPLGVAVPWAVRYFRRGHLPEEMLAVSLHPAPVYASLFALALFVGLSWLRGRQRVPGQVVLTFLGAYGLGRSVLEVFRADVERGLYFGGWVSTSQIIGVLSATVALSLLWVRLRRGEAG